MSRDLSDVFEGTRYPGTPRVAPPISVGQPCASGAGPARLVESVRGPEDERLNLII
jgi:hypothetical protein